MLVAVYPKEPYLTAHFWTFENFKEHHNASIEEYKINGNVIEYIIYEVPIEIDYDYVDQLELKCIIIDK